MRTMLIALLTMWSTVSWAQEGRPFNQRIWCFDQRAVNEVLSRDYKETAIFHGESDAVQYVLYANDKTGGWTMIGYQDGLGCIMAAGKKHTQFFGPKI
jgi:hypothetical protein